MHSGFTKKFWETLQKEPISVSAFNAPVPEAPTKEAMKTFIIKYGAAFNLEVKRILNDLKAWIRASWPDEKTQNEMFAILDAFYKNNINLPPESDLLVKNYALFKTGMADLANLIKIIKLDDISLDTRKNEISDLIKGVAECGPGAFSNIKQACKELGSSANTTSSTDFKAPVPEAETKEAMQAFIKNHGKTFNSEAEKVFNDLKAWVSASWPDEKKTQAEMIAILDHFYKNHVALQPDSSHLVKNYALFKTDMAALARLVSLIKLDNISLDTRKDKIANLIKEMHENGPRALSDTQKICRSLSSNTREILQGIREKIARDLITSEINNPEIRKELKHYHRTYEIHCANFVLNKLSEILKIDIIDDYWANTLDANEDFGLALLLSKIEELIKDKITPETVLTYLTKNVMGAINLQKRRELLSPENNPVPTEPARENFAPGPAGDLEYRIKSAEFNNPITNAPDRHKFSPDAEGEQEFNIEMDEFNKSRAGLNQYYLSKFNIALEDIEGKLGLYGPDKRTDGAYKNPNLTILSLTNSEYLDEDYIYAKYSLKSDEEIEAMIKISLLFRLETMGFFERKEQEEKELSGRVKLHIPHGSIKLAYLISDEIYRTPLIPLGPCLASIETPSTQLKLLSSLSPEQIQACISSPLHIKEIMENFKDKDMEEKINLLVQLSPGIQDVNFLVSACEQIKEPESIIHFLRKLGRKKAGELFHNGEQLAIFMSKVDPNLQLAILKFLEPKNELLREAFISSVKNNYLKSIPVFFDPAAKFDPNLNLLKFNDPNNLTAIQLACKEGRLDMLLALQKQGGKLDINDLSLMIEFKPSIFSSLYIRASEFGFNQVDIAKFLSTENKKTRATAWQDLICNASLESLNELFKSIKPNPQACEILKNNIQKEKNWQEILFKMMSNKDLKPDEKIKMLIKYFPEANKLKSYLANALVKINGKEKGSANGLQCLMFFNKTGLDNLFEFMDDSPQGKVIQKYFINALTHKSSSKMTAFQSVIMRLSGASLPRFFELFNDPSSAPIIKSKLASVFSDKNSNHKTCLNTFIYYHPQSLTQLFQLMDSSREGRSLKSSLAKALIEKDEDQVSGLENLIKDCPDSLEAFLSLLDDTKEGKKIKTVLAEDLANSLSKNKPTYLSPLFSQASPATINKFFDVIHDGKEGQNLKIQLANALAIKDAHGNTALRTLALDNPHCILKLLSLIDNSDSGQILKNKFALALQETNSAGESAISALAVGSPPILKTLLDLVDKFEDKGPIRSSVFAALAKTNTRGTTAIEHLFKSQPQLTLKILELTKPSNEPLNKELMNSFINLINKHGLPSVVVSAPATAEPFLAQVFKRNDLHELKEKIIDSLAEYTPGATKLHGLHFITTTCPGAIIDIFKGLSKTPETEKSKELKNNFFHALASESGAHHYSGLQNFLRNAPQTFKKFLDLLYPPERHQEEIEKLCSILVSNSKKVKQEKIGIPIIYMIVKFFPDLLSSLSRLMDTTAAGLNLSQTVLDGLKTSLFPPQEDRTLLHDAMAAKDLNLIKMLLDLGFNPSEKDNKGITPIDLLSVETRSAFVKTYPELAQKINLSPRENPQPTPNIQSLFYKVPLTTGVIKAPLIISKPLAEYKAEPRVPRIIRRSSERSPYKIKTLSTHKSQGPAEFKEQEQETPSKLNTSPKVRPLIRIKK